MDLIPTQVDQLHSQYVELLSKNPLAWGDIYFGHHLRMTSPPFHMKLMCECLQHRRLAVQAPRESSKSTIVSFLYSTHAITFKRKRFIIIVQNTFGKAKETLNNIKNEFKENQMLRNDYGIKVHRDLEGDSIIVHPDGFKTRILCKGAEQIGSIRGEKFGAYRPDLAIIDDLEDDEMVKNPERRRALQSLYDDALVPAVDKQTGQIIIIGTILHDDCQMAKLVSTQHYPEYRKLFYIARYYNTKEKKFLSLWKEKWTLEELNHMEKVKPEVFAKEYQGDPVTGSLKNFEKRDFRRWYIENDEYYLLDKDNRVTSKGKMLDCRAAIGVDLAWDEKKLSDFTVLMPIYLTPNSDILIDDYFCERGVRPEQFENMLFPMEQKLKQVTGKFVYIAWEKGKLEKVMKWFLGQAMKRRNYFLNFKDIPWVHDKIARIVTVLQSRYKLHTIYHKSGMEELEYQLMRVPSGTHDDLPDALQMAVRSLEFAPTKSKKDTPVEDEGFEWLRNQVIKRDNPPKKNFQFGKTKRLWKNTTSLTWK